MNRNSLRARTLQLPGGNITKAISGEIPQKKELVLQQVSINLSRRFTETSDEVFEKLPSSPGDDLEEVETLKETEHETGEIATSVEFVDTPLDAIVAFADRTFYTADKGCEEASIDDFLMKLSKMLPKLNNWTDCSGTAYSSRR